MSKSSKNKRIKELEAQVNDLKTTITAFMEFVGYEGKGYVSNVETLNIKTVNINISK